MQTLEECLLSYRQQLRRLLYEKGVMSNPGVTDDWIIEQVSRILRDGRPGLVVSAEQNSRLEHLKLLLEGKAVIVSYSYPGIRQFEAKCESVDFDFAIGLYGVRTPGGGCLWFDPETLSERVVEGHLPAHAGGRIKFDIT